MANSVVRVASIAAVILFTAPAAQAASARTVFEQYGLLGTFAVNCARPVSPGNHYMYFRPLDEHRVHVELMVGPQ
jgi:hypothetical protein